MDCHLKQISGACKSNTVYISRDVYSKKGNRVFSITCQKFPLIS